MELLSISKQNLGLFCVFLFLLGEFQAFFKQKEKTAKVCWVLVWFHSWEEEWKVLNVIFHVIKFI